jgi:hypothetical protein
MVAYDLVQHVSSSPEQPLRDAIPADATIRLVPALGGNASFSWDPEESELVINASGLRILELTPRGLATHGFSPPLSASEDSTIYAPTGALQRRYAAAHAAAAARGPVTITLRHTAPAA